MHGRPGSADDEVVRLRGCLNDLVGMMALPALWAGGDAMGIVGTLLDALHGTLHLAFAFARLHDPEGGAPAEILRVNDALPGTSRATVHRAIASALGDASATAARRASGVIGEVGLATTTARLGPAGEIGVVVVGCQRRDFPAQTERLLLDVAVNQAAVALQQARLLSAETRRASDLDERVARRTSELAMANASLSREVGERRRTEDALRESERESRLIVDTIPGLVALLTATGDVEVVNLQLLEYFGQTLEELRQWGTTGAVHPEDLPHVAEVFARSVAAEVPYEIAQRFRRADGAYRWFTNKGFPLRDATGRLVRWCVLLTDIDQQRRAEEALRASERRLKVTIDTIPALAWSARPDGTGDFFSQHYLDYLGFTVEQASGAGWTTAVHPDDLPGLAVTWQRIIASERLGEAEARLRRHDGTYRWFLFRANPLRDESGDVTAWYGINTDIEDRKQAEDALLRSEAFLLDVQRLSHIGGWRYDVATGAVDDSPEPHPASGVRPDGHAERISLRFERIHPDDRARVEAEFARCLGERSVFRAAYRVIVPDVGERYHHATGHPVTNDAGQLVEFVGAAMDMTEHWQATSELERASAALRELQAEMSRAAQVATAGELAASIAHEVNQPLSGILTNANTCLRMLAAEPPNVEGARETARRTLRDGGRASDVITRLRALFSKEELTLEPIDLNDATREIVALSSNDLQRNRVLLQLELADDLPVITGDRVQLQQVILNLLRNAADAMATVHDRPRQVVVRTERDDGDGVRVTVRDSGIGVDPQTLRKLFDAFYTTKRGGMGVGLSVSRSIVERHDGRLWAEANDGPGATFAFAIPGTPDRSGVPGRDAG